MIQVYTGDGRGKTTASLGLALRATGAGLKVFVAQFIKGRCCSELKALRRIKNIKVEQFGRGCFIRKSPGKEDSALAKKGLKRIKKIIAQKIYDVVILDEINVVLSFKMLALKDVIAMLKNAPKNLELILTGRNAPQEILKAADLVSEIKDVKHYFKNGMRARKGFEF